MTAFADDFVTIHHGDCLTIMASFDAASVDAIVSDPPYGLSFMGRDWDHGVPGEHFWREALRVAKPGAHLVAFGGTRTFHRLACAIEDAGWEVRDCLGWLYGSGFPKSLNLGNGWGTALKPAWEPIILARKPLVGTVARNVQTHGTGALNIDGCRVAHDEECRMMAPSQANIANPSEKCRQAGRRTDVLELKPEGRWPANIVHDGSDEVLEVFPQSDGQMADVRGTEPSKPFGGVCYGTMNGRFGEASAARRYTADGSTDFAPLPGQRRGDTGSAARFFYCAKATKAEREDGMYDAPEVRCSDHQSTDGVGGDNPRNRTNHARRNHHPTVKARRPHAMAGAPRHPAERHRARPVHGKRHDADRGARRGIPKHRHRDGGGLLRHRARSPLARRTAMTALTLGTPVRATYPLRTYRNRPRTLTGTLVTLTDAAATLKTADGYYTVRREDVTTIEEVSHDE